MLTPRPGSASIAPRKLEKSPSSVGEGATKKFITAESGVNSEFVLGNTSELKLDHDVAFTASILKNGKPFIASPGILYWRGFCYDQYSPATRRWELSKSEGFVYRDFYDG